MTLDAPLMVFAVSINLLAVLCNSGGMRSAEFTVQQIAFHFLAFIPLFTCLPLHVIASLRNSKDTALPASRLWSSWEMRKIAACAS